jgi:hypothetical protein
MEMTELWKANTRLSTAPWKSRREREIPTFPQLRRRAVLQNEKQKQKTPNAVYTKILTPPIKMQLARWPTGLDLDYGWMQI